MGSNALNLKVLVGIAQDGPAFKGLIDNLNTLLSSLKNLSKTPVDSLGTLSADADKASKSLKDLGGSSKGIKDVGDSAKDASKEIKSLAQDVAGLFSRLRQGAEAFLALELVKFVKDLADTAAHSQVLATTMNIVARNAGISAIAIKTVDKEVQALGITAASSRQSLTRMVEAGLDINKAAPLARMSQDAAALSGGLMNSSQTFERLVLAIQIGRSQILREIGVLVNFEEGYQKFVDTHNAVAEASQLTVRSLTEEEKVEARTNQTLEYGVRIRGAYIAAMHDVGKELTSLPRFVEGLKDAVGGLLLPAYAALVKQTTLLLEDLTKTAESEGENETAGQKLADVVRVLATALKETIEFVVKFHNQIGIGIGLFAAYKLLIFSISTITSLIEWFTKVSVVIGGEALAHTLNTAAILKEKQAKDTLIATNLELAESEATTAEVTAGSGVVSGAGTVAAGAGPIAADAPAAAGALSLAWTALSKAGVELIATMARLATQYGITGGSAGGLALKFGLSATALGVFGVTVYELVSAGTRFGDVFAWIGGVGITLAATLSGVVGRAIDGVISSIVGMYRATQEGKPGWDRTWAGFNTRLGETLAFIRHIAQESQDLFDHAFRGIPVPDRSKEGEGGRKYTYDQYTDAQATKNEAQSKADTAKKALDIYKEQNPGVYSRPTRENYDALPPAAKQFLEEYQKANQALGKATEEAKKVTAGTDKAVIAKADAVLDYAKKMVEREKATAVTTKLLEGVGKKNEASEDAISRTEQLVKEYNNPQGSKAVLPTKLVDQFKEASKEITNATGHLQRFKKAVDAATKRPLPIKDPKTGIVTQGPAAITVAQAQDFKEHATRAALEDKTSYDKDAVSRAEKNLKDKDKIDKLDSEQALVMQKQTHDAAQKLDDVAYKNGLRTLGEYYDAKMVRTKQDNALALKIAQVNVVNAQKEYLRASGDNKGGALVTLKEAQAKLAEAPGIGDAKEADVVAAKEADKLKIEEKIATLHSQILQTQDTEAGKLSLLREAYDKEFKEIRGNIVAQGLLVEKYALLEKKLRQEGYDALKEIEITTTQFYGAEIAKRQSILFEAEKEKRKFAGQRNEQGVRAEDIIDDQTRMKIQKDKNDQLDEQNKKIDAQIKLSESSLSVEKASFEVLKNSGTLTHGETMAGENELIKANIVLTEQKMALAQREIAQQEKQIKDNIALQESKRAREIEANTMLAPGVKPHEILTDQQISDAQDPIRLGIAETQSKVIEFQAQLITFGDSFQNYGKEIQKSFTEGFGQALSDTMTGAKSAGDSFQAMVQGWGKQMAVAASKNITTQVTNLLVDSSSQKYKAGDIDPSTKKQITTDQIGTNKPNTSIFDKLGGIFAKTDKVKIPGETRDHPSYIEFAKQPDNAPPSIGTKTVNADGTPVAGAATPGTGLLGGTTRIGSSPGFVDPTQPGGISQDINSALKAASGSSSSSGSSLSKALSGALGTNKTYDQKNILQKAFSNLGMDPLTLSHANKARAFAKAHPGYDQGQPNIDNSFDPNVDTSSGSSGSSDVNPNDFETLGGGSVGDSSDYNDLMAPSWDSGGYAKGGLVTGLNNILLALAGGGMVSGAGTGTSDSIPARLSHGEYVTPAAQTTKFYPLLESIRSGRLANLAGGGLVWDGRPISFASGGLVQSIAPLPLVQSSGGEAAKAAGVTPGPHTMNVQLHPDAVNLSMKDFMEREISRQFSRR